MEAYISNKHKLVVFWSPKCGCTSVVNWFYTNVLGENSLRQHEQRIFLRRYQKSYKWALRLLCKEKKYKSVAFVRNPISRPASAYINKFLYRNKKPILDFENLEDFSKNFYNEYLKYYKIKTSEYIGISFREYLEFILNCKETNKILDGHFDTQTTSEFIIPDFYVKLENFSDDLSHINKAFGLSDYIPSVLNSTNDTMPNALDENLILDNMKSVELLSLNALVKKRNILSEYSLELINQIYEVDFLNLNYKN